MAPIGIVSACFWLDDMARLTTRADAIAVVLIQMSLLVTASAWVVCRFQCLTLYRLELDGDVIRARSVLKAWNIQLSDIEGITPGWHKPWWTADHNRYVIEREECVDLFIWCGKGLIDFLECVGTVDPRLVPKQEDGTSRVERARGKSGFAGMLPTT